MNLAQSLWAADRHDEAIAVEEDLVAESARIHGADDTETLTARRDLASSYRQAGDSEKALALQTRLVADLERVLGLDHPATLAAKKTLEAG